MLLAMRQSYQSVQYELSPKFSNTFKLKKLKKTVLIQK